MALPIVAAPEFEATIPSTGQKIFFRPFLVKEEKSLYMALEGGEQNEIVNAVTNVLTSCIKSDVDVSKLSYFDIEYLFLKLRSKSVGEEVTLRFRHGGNDPECKHVTEVVVNLDDVELQKDEDHTDKVMVTDSIGVKLKYPTLDTAKNASNLDMKNIGTVFEFIADSIEYVFDQENIYEDSTREERREWVESLNQSQFEKITGFFNTMPKLSKDIEYKCEACGKDEKITIEGLQGFFV